MYKLIAVDLDGTLLNSQQWVSDENQKAVRYAASKGVKVVICSGRIYDGAKVFARQLDLKQPLIACNGAVITDTETGDVIYNNCLKREDCFKIIDICHEQNIYFHAYIGNTMYTERMEYSSVSFGKRNLELPEEDRIDIRLVKSIAEVLEKSEISASKIVVMNNDKKLLLKVRGIISEIDTVSVMSSNFDNFEVVNFGVSKGNALKFVAEKLGIHREEVIAIGDNENDYSMLKYAGLGVAMGNAEHQIKEIADYVTLTNDENGVAEMIKKFIR